VPRLRARHFQRARGRQIGHKLLLELK
jgi:hypothetical protein